MNQTVTVPSKTIEEILTRLERLTKEVRIIKTRLFKEEPGYGSSEWWTRSNTKALQEVRDGKGTVIHNKKEMKEFFQNLRDA